MLNLTPELEGEEPQCKAEVAFLHPFWDQQFI